jgi:hypothetical protein
LLACTQKLKRKRFAGKFYSFLISCLPRLPNATAEIEKTAGVCGSAKAYFLKANLVSFSGIALFAKNMSSFFLASSLFALFSYI